MNEETLGVFIAETFIPFLPFIAAGITAFLIIIMFLVMFNGFLPKDR